MRFLITLGAAGAIALLSGCSTTQGVTTGPQAKAMPMTTACLTVHGGNSKDMDAALRRSLEAHGVSVQTTPACDKTTAGVDMTVTYDDKWWWDVVMYLRAVDIRFYSAPAGGLIASGFWKNSPLHSFPNADGVVSDLVNDMFTQAGAPGTLRTSKASQ